MPFIAGSALAIGNDAKNGGIDFSSALANEWDETHLSDDKTVAKTGHQI